MCHKNSPPTINMQENSAKPARKSRTKLRKPKFLSLRLELSTQSPETAAEEMGRRDRHRRKSRRRNHLSLLPAGRQESSSIDVEIIRDDENVAVDFLFNGDDTSATTLSGLLDGEGAAQPADMVSSPVDSVGSRDSVSTQLRDAIEYTDRRSSLLVRTAMKSGGCRGTDHGEEMVEKWVSYSEVVERKIHEDEVSSCTAANHGLEGRRRRRVVEKEAGQLLCLKLDYEQVLSSWSDKGSLFIHGGGVDHHYHEPPPQTVPELGCELLTRDSAVGGQMDGLAGAVNVWAVPDVQKGDINLEEKDQAWLKQREASVMRYKEKRQNRLFAKRIRYEVRKLNAESRPRVKGRFVRRD